MLQQPPAGTTTCWRSDFSPLYRQTSVQQRQIIACLVTTQSTLPFVVHHLLTCRLLLSPATSAQNKKVVVQLICSHLRLLTNECQVKRSDTFTPTHEHYQPFAKPTCITSLPFSNPFSSLSTSFAESSITFAQTLHYGKRGKLPTAPGKTSRANS